MTEDQQNALDQDAIRWLVTLQDDEATADDRAEFARWLATGPAHQAAWRWACEVWAEADKAAPAIRQSQTEPGSVVAFRAKPRASFGRWLQVAAAVCVIAAGAALALHNPTSIARVFAQAKTGVGDMRSLTLADGSVAEMGSDTALSFAVEDGRRVVTLYSGEAHFRVAPDRARAFTVKAGDGAITALGTAFNVKLLRESVNVAVTEHSVEVAVAGDRLQLANGQQITYGARGIGAVSAADPASVLAWQRRRLVLQQVELGDVLADIERSRAGRILVLDDAVRTIPVTAVLDIADTDAALTTIARTFPVKVTQISRYLTLISAIN